MNDNIDILNRLKTEKDAVILAHYYVPGDVQDVADYIGDSFYLSKLATTVPQKTIVFCGVHFMGESAKILNPEKTVLMPDIKADCPMAHLAIPEDVAQIRSQYQDLSVVCYINSTTELKSCSDVCVTSSNAVKVVRSLPEKNIYFIPDQNLARFVAEQIPEKNFIFNDGYCPTHKRITAEDIRLAKTVHPKALILAHPECTKEVLELCDFVGSTLEIINFSCSDSSDEYLIATELGVIHEMQKRNPQKHFFPVSEKMICPNMKMNSVEKIIHVLETGANEIILDEEVRLSSLPPLQRMLDLAK